MFKKILSKYRLPVTYALIFILSIILNILYHYINSNKYYLFYPKNTNRLLFILISLFILIAGITIFKFIIEFKKNVGRNRIVIYVVLTSFCLLITLNLFQYKLYLLSPDSFIVNETIKQFHVDRETKKLDYLVNQYSNTIGIADSIRLNLNKDTLNTFYIDSRTMRSDTKYVYQGYLCQLDNIQIYFRENVLDTRIPRPPLPPESNGQKEIHEFDLDALNMFFGSNDINILRSQNTIDYFDSIKTDILNIPTRHLIAILDSFIYEGENRVITLNENKSLIEKRGLPIGVFILDSLKIVFGGIDDYKPLGWTGRLIEILQLILTVMILMPLVGEPYIWIKKHVNEKID